MSGILIGTEGKLTKKQKQSIEIVETILLALIEHEPLDWKRLLEKTKPLSKGALHKWLVELVHQGVVKGEVKIVNNRLIPFYKYTRKPFWIEGKEEIHPREVCRFYLTEKGVVGYEWGYLKKGKGGSRYFVTLEGKKPIQ